MKRRVLPEPMLHIDPSWYPPLIRWRRRYGVHWAYAAWWLHGGQNFYTKALRRAKSGRVTPGLP